MRDRVDGDYVRKRVVSNLWLVVSTVATVGGAATFTVLVVTTPDITVVSQVLASLSVVLAVMVAGLGLSYRQMSADVRRLRNQREELKGSTDDDLYALAFSVFLYDADRAIDNRHAYDHQTRHIDLTEDGTEYRYVLSGANRDTDRRSEGLRLKLSGDVNHGVDDLGIEAYQHEPLEPGEEAVELEPERIGDRRTDEALIEIPFRRPLEPGESFEVEFQCGSLGGYEQDQSVDYRYMPLHRFIYGVDEVSATLTVDSSVSQVTAVKVRWPGQSPTKDTAGQIPIDEFDIENIEVAPQERRDAIEYSFTDDERADSLYMFKIEHE